MINSAESIGQRLLLEAVRIKDRLFWLAPDQSVNKSKIEMDISLRTGATGILFFFLELYNVTGKIKYLTALRRGINGVKYVLKNSSSNDYSLYGGKMGFALLLLKTFEKTCDNCYLETLRTIAMNCTDFLKSEFVDNSLTNGRAGTLLVLLQTEKLLHDNLLRNNISIAVTKILQDVNIVNGVPTWQENSAALLNHEGWNEGDLGIASALNIAAVMLDCKHLNEISFMCVKGALVNFKRERRKKLAKFPIREKKAIGKLWLPDRSSDPIEILFAIFHSKSQIFEAQVTNLLKASLPFRSDTNYERQNFLMHFGQVYQRHDHKKPPSKTSLPKGLGLVHGIAGLGYNYLLDSNRIANPYFSFLLDASSAPVIKYRLSNTFSYYEVFFDKFFKRTRQMFDKDSNQFLQKRFNQIPCINDAAALAEVDHEVKILSRRNDRVDSVYRLEVLKYKLFMRSCRYNLDHFSRFKQNARLQTYKTSTLLKLKFQLTPHVDIVSIGKAASKRMPFASTFLLVRVVSQNPMEMQEEIIGGINTLVSLFKYPTSGYSVINRLAKTFSNNDRKEIAEKIVELILFYVQRGVVSQVDELPIRVQH